MSENDNGGFFYPGSQGAMDRFRGITRRDWLAGLAMGGMLGNMENASGSEMLIQFNAIPKLAYRMADAMIAESKKGD